MPHAIGSYVDERFEICALLSEGGMSRVYRAIDTATGGEVVLKMPHAEFVGDLAAFKLFQREMEVLQGLEHPGLQRLRSEPGAGYIALDYVPGDSLRTVLAHHGPLPIEQVLHIGSALSETLQYVHDQGIIHRDVKPENTLIGPDGHVTLVDFGIAARLSARQLTLNHLSNAVGTPDYMAPEQVRGERGDVRTDIYALGVMLFELVTGVLPYPSDDTPEVKRRADPTEPPLIRRLRPEAAPSLEAVLYRALRRRPDERYASMATLGHDLANLDEVVVPDSYAVDIPPPKPAGDLPPARTLLPILAAILGLLLVLGVVAQLAHRGVASP